MKSVMLSIQPKYCELIASGKKTIEVRKSAPKLETPFKCYIYETKGKKVECGFHFEETGRTLRDKYVFGMHEARIVKHYRNEGKGKVIGEFVCDKIDIDVVTLKPNGIEPCYWKLLNGTCLTKDELIKYGKYKELYGWHITDLKIYDKPKELSEFKQEIVKGAFPVSVISPPKSWFYIEELVR